MLEFIVWCMLAVLGWIGLSAAIERVLFHLTRRPADETALRDLLHQWEVNNKVSQLVKRESYGWLDPFLVEADGSTALLLERCRTERQQMLRWSSVLPMVGDVATAAGLLAAVISLYQTANAAEHGAVIALGMRATIVGLLIAIPIKIFLGLSADRADRLVNQADGVIEALEKLLYHAVPIRQAEQAPRGKAKKTQPLVDKDAKPKRTRDDDFLDTYEVAV